LIESSTIDSLFIEKILKEKPDLLALSASQPGFFPAFLESQSLNEKIGRYDILFAAPSIEMVAFEAQQFEQLLAVIDATPIQQAVKQKQADQASNICPFQFGWLVYFSYESAYLLEPKLKHLLESTTEPLAVAIYCQGAIVYDRITEEVKLYAQSEVVADAIEALIIKATVAENDDFTLLHIQQAPDIEFEQAVIQAKELIVAGDIYQANLSRQYHCHIGKNISPATVMAQLKAANPAPFAGMLQINDFAVVSSSPERLFSIRDGMVETRPIAGTRPRGHSKATDLALIQDLLDTPKEQAEHIMLIDLERNDMGKVCKNGTVKVDELMVIESYQHVHHIVSNITGELKPDVSMVDVLKALFPGGTITGCPKIRCMEVIRDIEKHDRGCYTGSMGYINHGGQVDLNILIRTVAMCDGEISFNAGAGIVFDSDPSAELQETKHKAKGLINALSMTELDSSVELQ
jgi:anthranilate synthase component 1